MCRISAHNKMSELLNRNTDPLFEKMEKIFAERDAEYKKMEERNRMREEAVKEKENSLKKQEEQFSSREANVRQQEKEIEEKMQMLEEKQRETQEMEKHLQKKRLELEADEQQSLLDNSILREEIRNEKLKQQRLSRELEDKLADLGYSSDNLADPAILEEKEKKLKEQEQEIQHLNEEIEKWEDKADEWEEKESGFVTQIDTLNKEKAQLWKKLMGVDDAADKSLAGQEENIFDKVERPAEEKSSENEESLQEVEAVEVVPEEESEYAKEEENLQEAMEMDGMDTPLTAEGFYNYLQEQEVGGVIQLRHAKQGDMVNIAISKIVVTVVFAEEGWFDIKKPFSNNHKLRRLIRNWNKNQSDLTFQYDTTDNTVTAEGDFDKDQTAEELLTYLDRLLDTYFDTDTGEEE